MLKSVTLLCLVLINNSVTAQITAEKYAATITAADLKKHLTIIASAEMEGRETATEGQKKAAAYIETFFKSIKLVGGNNGSYQQVYSLMEDSMLNSTVKVDSREYKFGKDYMMASKSNKTYFAKSEHIIFAGYGIDEPTYNDYAQLDIKGAIVVLSTGEPKLDKKGSWSLTRKIKKAYEKGAAGVFVFSKGMQVIDSEAAYLQRLTGVYLPDDHKKERPATNYAFISRHLFETIFGRKLAKKLVKKIDSSDFFSPGDHVIKKKDTEFGYTTASYESGTSSNVIGVIEGTDKKDEYVFITAHYDHIGKKGPVIYYGADDDGSGTVSVLEMAEAFATAKNEGNGPRRTIVFMTVSGEEKGLWGSEYYSDHPIFPLDKTTVDLNTDMVGRIDPKRKYGDSMNYVYIIGDDKISSDLKTISESVNINYTKLELDYKYNDPLDPERIFYRSDQYNFARKGIPIIFYFNGTHADYHQPTDTVDKINFPLMEKRVHLIFFTAWEMANRDDMLKRDIPLR